MAAPLSFLMVKTGCFASSGFPDFASMFFMLASLFLYFLIAMYRVTDGQLELYFATTSVTLLAVSTNN